MVKSFFKGLGVSFSGSLPIGIMNMAALQVSIEQGRKAAIGFACAAIFLEGFVIFLTGRFSEWLTQRDKMLRRLEEFSILLLYLIAAYFGYRAWGPTAHSGSVVQIPMPGWQYGVWLRLLNPTAIIFWLGIHIALTESQGSPHEHRKLAVFTAGAMMGTFCAYAIYLTAAHELDDFLKPLGQWLNGILAVLCIIGASYKWKTKNNTKQK